MDSKRMGKLGKTVELDHALDSEVEFCSLRFRDMSPGKVEGGLTLRVQGVELIGWVCGWFDESGQPRVEPMAWRLQGQPVILKNYATRRELWERLVLKSLTGESLSTLTCYEHHRFIGAGGVGIYHDTGIEIDAHFRLAYYSRGQERRPFAWLGAASHEEAAERAKKKVAQAAVLEA